MPATFNEVVHALGLVNVSPAMAQPAIELGAYYMARLRKVWSSPRPALDRQQLAQASYNAGAGSLIAAQRLCGMPVRYAEIAACLPDVTGAHARETLDYVPRIARWRAMMEAGIR